MDEKLTEILPGYSVYGTGPKEVARFAKSANEARLLLGAHNIGIFEDGHFTFLESGFSVLGDFYLVALVQLDDCVGVFYSDRHKKFMLGCGPKNFMYVDDPFRAICLMGRWSYCDGYEFSLEGRDDPFGLISCVTGKWHVRGDTLYVDDPEDFMALSLKA